MLEEVQVQRNDGSIPPTMVQGEGSRAPQTAPARMWVLKRNGDHEPVDISKIVRAVERCADGLDYVDPMLVATRTISGLYAGATTKELDQLSIRIAASLIVEEPEYAKLAARLLATYVDKEVALQDIHSFSQSVGLGHKLGLVNDRMLEFVTKNSRKLNDAISTDRYTLFEYFGLRTMYDRYLLKHPTSRQVIETPQHFFMRVACALSETVSDALELYELFSTLSYIPSSPTLFNAGTRHEQLSSCFLLDSPQDTLENIYQRYTDIAMLSKFSGGIGLAFHRVRSRGSLIRSTNGQSNGIVPWLKTLDASVAAVNQGGRRRGACCVYLENWHADIEEFLELRDNTGDEARRTHNLNLANWVSDLFMRRVEADGDWSLFDPKDVPTLTDLWGDAFTAAYEEAERAGLAQKTVKARDLYGRMMRTLAQTGNGWMTFKDKSNSACNQTALPGRTVHLSNLCTEIIEITSNEETAVCLAEGTQILTERGLLPIEQCDGVRVYVPFADDSARERADRFALATLIDNGERDVVRVQLSDGRSICATADHRFLVRLNPHRTSAPDRHAWRQASDLVPGDLVVTPHTSPVAAEDTPLDEDWAAAGWLVGDGWQSDVTYGACFAAPELLAQKQVLAAFARWYDVSPLGHNAPHDNLPSLRVDRNGVMCWASSRKGFIEYVQHRFGIFPHLAAKKELPHRLDLTDHNALRSFLSGLFSADGHIGIDKGKPYVALTSASHRLALQVRSALTTFGIHGRIRRSARPDGRVWYILSISGGSNVALFNRFVGFSLSDAKQEKLDAYVVVEDGYRNVRETASVALVEPAGRSRVYDLSVEDGHHFIAESVVTHNCNLGSINLSKHLNADNTFDFDKLGRTVRAAVRQLDRVIDLNYYPINSTRASNMRWRPVGLGVMGLQDVFFAQRLPFDSEPARALSAKIAEEIYFHALTTSCDLAEAKGQHTAFPETRAARGELQFDAWGVKPQDSARWDALRERVKLKGLRNSLLIAVAPTATIASIASCYECIEPQISNLFKRETLSGDFLQINRYLVTDLKALGLWTEELRTRIKVAEGSVQGIEEIPEDVRAIYRTAWEVPMRSLIDMAADRGAFIDQSQSLNLFMESPNIGQLSSMYMYAWKKGLKTTYYLRSRPATRITKTTVKAEGVASNVKWGQNVQQAAPAARDADAVACSLENPESCEACQ